MSKDIWITAGTAAKILEERLGRPIRVDYITKLGQMGRLRTQHMGSRIVLYHRHDVEVVKIRERKKPSSVEASQVELPIAEKVVAPPVEEKTIDAILKQPTPQICNVARFEDMPPGSLKRAAFAKQHGIHNPELGTWLELGVKGDTLPVTYYPHNQSIAAAFSPTQQEQVLEILKRHGKLKS
jgi:hypothetical protein